MQLTDDRTLNSQAFVDRVCSGDERAFEAVFHAYYGRVYSLAYRLLGRADDADEVAQQTFLRLYQRPLPPGREHNLLGWLLRVAGNLSFNALRADRRRQARETKAEGDRPKAQSPDEAALAAHRAATVRLTLAGMPERQAQVLLLRYQGLGYAEIAAATGVSPTSVGTLLARAEQAFEQLYSKFEEGEEHVHNL
ncbi:MAG: sigma-70 family RNA polymerase sigma factor [Anaerolineae bacterium]